MKRKYDKIKAKMLQQQAECNKILGDGLCDDQKKAYESIIEFYKAVLKIDCKYFGQSDWTLDFTKERDFSDYAVFLNYLGEFRMHYMAKDYSGAVYDLISAIKYRWVIFPGSKAAVIEAGKLVMKDDFPKEEAN